VKIIFMGTPEFARVSLNTLLREKFNIVAAVTAPDRRAGRGLKLRESPVKSAAVRAGIPVLQPEKLSDPGFISDLKSIKPDVIAVVAFRILPEDVFIIPSKGTVNVHGSLLPRYRGAAPINWAIINGETETGVTTFFIKKEVDTGNILDQLKIPIMPDQTAGELHDIMAVKGAELLVVTLRKIERGNVVVTSQNESFVSRAPKIRREDCLIRFAQPAKKVHDFIRGLSPFPAAHTFLDGRMLRLYNSGISDLMTDVKSGTIVGTDPEDRWQIACGEGECITIAQVQLEGKRRMTTAEFSRGYSVRPGKILGAA
jgi:methionyl-tRNA formyltransferase